jgi:hypothetical protein
MFKDGVVLPQCMPKGTPEYDGWLAKLPQIVENGKEEYDGWLAKLPSRVENGTAEHEKWLAKLPSRVENGQEEYDGWLANHRGHYTNKHAEEHKDGTYLATCLECLLAEPITINDEISKVKKRVYGKLTAIKGTHIFSGKKTCQKCSKRSYNWRIESKAVAPLKATAPVAKKATAPVTKKAVVKKAAPRKHILLGFSRILRERKPRAAAPQKHSLSSLSKILNKRKLREQALWHQ